MSVFAVTLKNVFTHFSVIYEYFWTG